MKKYLLKNLAICIALIICFSCTASFSAESSAPNFKSGEYVDLLPYMKDTSYGKQTDDTDGKRMELKKSASGYTAKFNSQATNYGVKFNGDLVNPDGTYFYQFKLDKDNDLWDSANAEIYGGPVVGIGYGTTNDFTGYFSFLFTQKDGIDLRLSDKLGNDLFYIGANNASLKVKYPDTNSFEKGKNGYDVIVSINKKALSLWVNNTVVIDNVQFDKLYSSSGNRINIAFQNFESTIHTSASRTTVHNFRAYCLLNDINKDIVKVDNTTNSSSSSTTSSNKNNSTQNNTSSNSSKTNSQSSSNSSTLSEDNDLTSEDNDVLVDDEDELNKTDASVSYVKGQKVEFESPIKTMIIVGISVLSVGAILIVIYLIHLNKSRK